MIPYRHKVCVKPYLFACEGSSALPPALFCLHGFRTLCRCQHFAKSLFSAERAVVRLRKRIIACDVHADNSRAETVILGLDTFPDQLAGPGEVKV